MERILVVDDTSEFRTTVAMVLRKNGYEVSEAENGREAFDAIKTTRPQLIILDVIMPEMNGMSFLSELNAYKDFDKTPVILLTGLSIQDSLAKATNSRIVEYLIKSQFSVDDLLEKVRIVLNSQTARDLKSKSFYDKFTSFL